MSASTYFQRSRTQTPTTNQEAYGPHKQGLEDAQQRGHAGQSQLEGLPPDEFTADSLEALATTFQESLTAWSRGTLAKTWVIHAYDHMRNELDARIALFEYSEINTSDVESVSFALRRVLGDLLAEAVAPDRFDYRLPYIRASMVVLLEVHRSKHLEYIYKATGTSVIPSHTDLNNAEPQSWYGAHIGGNVDQHISSQPSGLVTMNYETPYPTEHPQQEAFVQQTRSTRLEGASGQSQGDHAVLPVPAVQTAITQLQVSIKKLLDSLTNWSKRKISRSDVSNVYLQVGKEFHATVAAFQESGMDISDLMSVPDGLRVVLEQILAEEATPENLEIYLPNVRQIIVNLLQELRVRQDAYTTPKSDLSKIPSHKLGERPSPWPSDDTNQLGPGRNTTTMSASSGSPLTRESASSVNAAPALNAPSEHLPGASGEDSATRSRVELDSELEPQPASQPAYNLDDASGTSQGNGRSHTQPDEALPSFGPSSITLNKSKITDPMVISRNMSIGEILEHLSRHGCNNVSSQLDTSKSSEYPGSSGGYGNVYRGAFRDGSSVAIKCLRLPLDEVGISQKQLRRAAQEIYVWSKCVHPNILGLTGVAQYRNQLAMVSPWMPYGNLRLLLSREPGTDRYNLCAQIVDGIAYLHEAGVVHGDLKGDNILFSEDLTPKLADFGNATLKEYTLQFSLTTSRAGMSINWVAPEVLKEDTGPTPEADIWSLGMTMLEVMTGEAPYAGILKFSVMRRIESKILPIRPEVHIPSQKTYADLIWSLFMACWTYDPLQRPSAMGVREKMKVVLVERDRERLDLQ